MSFTDLMLHRSSLFFSREELDKIMNTTVAIAGLGGVGAITAELLARWGIKKFRLLDKDKYEPTNLNRQLFATSKTLGQYKVDVAAKRIKEINPYTKIEMAIKDRISSENSHEFLKGADILIQTTDSPSSLLFYKIAQRYKVPVVNGYTTITGGYVSVYDYRFSKCYSFLERIKNYLKWRSMKKITKMTLKELDELDRKWGHKTSASINFVTNAVGCLIVAEAIKLLSGRGEVVKYPYQIEFDLFSIKLKKKKMYSPFALSNYKKLVTIFLKNNK